MQDAGYLKPPVTNNQAPMLAKYPITIAHSKRMAEIMSYRYKVVFEQEPDGGYSVHVPALPGCASQGDTFDEADANVQEAIKLFLWSLKDDGLPTPSVNYLKTKSSQSLPRVILKRNSF